MGLSLDAEDQSKPRVQTKNVFKAPSLIALHESADAGRFILRVWGPFSLLTKLRRDLPENKQKLWPSLEEDFTELVDLDSQLSTPAKLAMVPLAKDDQLCYPFDWCTVDLLLEEMPPLDFVQAMFDQKEYQGLSKRVSNMEFPLLDNHKRFQTYTLRMDLLSERNPVQDALLAGGREWKRYTI